MKLISIPVLVYLIIACSFTGKPGEIISLTKDSAAGKIEIYDIRALGSVDSNATIEIIGRNYKWSEGPVWIPAKQMLLFSDVRENKIFKWNATGEPVLFLTPSGYTDTAFRDGENGSNGLALDAEGRLIICQSGNRQVVRLYSSLDTPKPVFTILASNYKGKKFNSPNDLVSDKNSNIYFTDPVYGLPKRENDPTRELNFEGVYRISKSGLVTLLIDSIPRPNGIALSNDEKILYVGSSDAGHTKWFVYNLDGKGNIKSGGVLLDGNALRAKAKIKQGADGFKIDNAGNIYSAGPDGINIISPEGKLLGLIKIYNRPTSNCAFNESKNVLYITADDLVLKVKLRS